MQHFKFVNWQIGEFLLSFFDVTNSLKSMIRTIQIESNNPDHFLINFTRFGNHLHELKPQIKALTNFPHYKLDNWNWIRMYEKVSLLWDLQKKVPWLENQYDYQILVGNRVGRRYVNLEGVGDQYKVYPGSRGKG